MMLCRDASKYTVTVTPAVMQGWRDAGVGLLVIQSHPAVYGQERSLEIMRAAQVAGMPWDAYIYGYLAYSEWTPEALATLDLAAAEGLVPRKVWLDVEDVDSGKGWTPEQRVEAVRRDLAVCDARGGTVGIYSAGWYWTPYMGDTHEFGDRQLWAAQYDNVADTSVFTPFGGWQSCRIKQYAGSQPDGTDLNVLSAEEEAELTQQPPSDVDEAWQAKKGLIVSTAGELLAVADQITDEANRKGGPRVKATRTLASEVRARAQTILA